MPRKDSHAKAERRIEEARHDVALNPNLNKFLAELHALVEARHVGTVEKLQRELEAAIEATIEATKRDREAAIRQAPKRDREAAIRQATKRDREAAIRQLARPLNEAKVLFIGEAEVGKSSLIAALKDGKLQQHFDKTRGIVREQWWPDGEKTDALRLNLWDFGGQEVYHATHTFFLTKRAVYVVVVNARENDRQNNVEYWLQMARSFGGDAPVLVAINKCDQHGDGPDENLLRRKYGHDLQFIHTSCWTGEGLNTLKAAILERINRLDEVRREMPASWLQIKDKLEAITQDTLPLDDYRQLCVRHDVTDEETQDVMLKVWHELGTVLYFRRDLNDVEVSDMGILNPEWVTRGVYAVLDDAALKQRQGLLTPGQLAATLKRVDYRGGKSSFIEAMMRRFDLLYDAPDQRPRTMLVPRLLEEKEPPFNWPKTGTIRFLYRYEVLPAGLLPRFIVRWHQYLSQNPGPWRHGCVLEFGGCRALVRADVEAKTVEINVCGKPPSRRREALDKVRHTFDDIHSQIEDLPYEEFIPVPGHPDAPLLRYSHLRNLEWNDVFRFPAEGAKPGEIIEVDVSEALGSVRTAARKEREQAQARIHVEKFIGGHEMSGGIHVGGNVSDSRLNTGDNVVMGDNSQLIQQLAENPAQLKEEIAKLRALIEQARTAGADGDDCANAEEAAIVLGEVVEEPEKEGAKRKAKGALAILEGAAKGFQSLQEVGENFDGILKLVGPALGALLGTQL